MTGSTTSSSASRCWYYRAVAGVASLERRRPEPRRRGSGAQSAVRRAVAIPPAEAMRPEPPARYRPSVIETRVAPPARSRTTMRMVLRNLERQPVRAATSVVGIAFAGAILLIGFGFIDAMERADRRPSSRGRAAPGRDGAASSSRSRRDAVATRCRGCRACCDVEPLRIVPARLRAGHRVTAPLPITGLLADPRSTASSIVIGGAVVTLPAGRTGALADARARCSTSRAGGHGHGGGARGRAAGARGRRRRRLVDDTFGLLGLHGDRRAAPSAARGRHAVGRRSARGPGADRTRSTRAAQGDCRRWPAWRSTRRVIRNFRDTMAENMNVIDRSSTCCFAGDHRLRRRLQRRARLAVRAQPRAGQPARARLHARRDLAASCSASWRS